jgi:RNA polymerase sigma-70 factor, ECF subfamily
LTRDDDFRRLYESHAAAVARYVARRAGSNQRIVGDVVAETFLVAWRKQESVPLGPEALPWLLGVARRQLAAHMRKEVRALITNRRLGDDRSMAASTPDDAPRADLVTIALASLPELDREIFRLHCWEQLSQADVGVAVGLSRKSVERRMARARTRLRREIDGLKATDVDGRWRSNSLNDPGLATGEV